MTIPRVLTIQSHVVHGFVGNRCASFVLQRLGIDVDEIHTVQLSNHKSYPIATGTTLSGEEYKQICDALRKNNLSTRVTHVLAGYIGSTDVLKGAVDTVQELRRTKPEMVFFCDPVLGDNGMFYVPKELVELYRSVAVPLATTISPNQFEAEQLTKITIGSISDAIIACQKLHALGPKTVIITSLVGLEGSTDWMTLLASTQEKQKDGHPACFTIKIPRLDYKFSGTGDVLSSLLLGLSLKHPLELDWVCEQATSRLHALLQRTLSTSNRYPGPIELDLVREQSVLVSTIPRPFTATTIDVTHVASF